MPTMIEVYGSEVEVDDLGYPVDTPTGVRCGNHLREQRVHHTSVAAVRFCFDITAEQVETAAEEQRSERLTTRFFEEGF